MMENPSRVDSSLLTLLKMFKYYQIKYCDYSTPERKVGLTTTSEVKNIVNEFIQLLEKHVVIKIMNAWVQFIDDPRLVKKIPTGNSFVNAAIKSNNEDAIDEIKKTTEIVRCINNFDTIPVFMHKENVLLALVLFNDEKTKYYFPLSLRCDGDLVTFFKLPLTDESLKVRYLMDVAKSVLTFCHLLDKNCELSHGDLKPANMLYKLDAKNESIRFLVTDFGTVEKVPNTWTPYYKQLNCTDLSNPLFKQVTEVTDGKRNCARKNDLYAIGLILLEQVTKMFRRFDAAGKPIVSSQFRNTLDVIWNFISWCLELPSDYKYKNQNNSKQIKNPQMSQAYLVDSCVNARDAPYTGFNNKCYSKPGDTMATYTFKRAVELIDQIKDKPPMHPYSPPPPRPIVQSRPAYVSPQVQQQQQQQKLRPPPIQHQNLYHPQPKPVQNHQPLQQVHRVSSPYQAYKAPSQRQRVVQQKKQNPSGPAFRNTRGNVNPVPPPHVLPAQNLSVLNEREIDQPLMLKDITINGTTIIPQYRRPGYAAKMDLLLEEYDKLPKNSKKFSISDQLAILEWKWRRTAI